MIVWVVVVRKGTVGWYGCYGYQYHRILTVRWVWQLQVCNKRTALLLKETAKDATVDDSLTFFQVDNIRAALGTALSKTECGTEEAHGR